MGRHGGRPSLKRISSWAQEKYGLESFSQIAATVPRLSHNIPLAADLLRFGKIGASLATHSLSRPTQSFVGHWRKLREAQAPPLQVWFSRASVTGCETHLGPQGNNRRTISGCTRERNPS